MKKILITYGSLAFRAKQQLSFIVPYTYASLNHNKSACFSTSIPENVLFEKGDLNVTEIEATDKAKRKDSVERAKNKVLLLNAAIDWSSTNAENFHDVEDFSEQEETLSTPAKKTILFKINSKRMLKEYPACGKLLNTVENLGFPSNILFEMIKKNPEISTFHPDLVNSNLSQLMNLGFSPIEIKIVVNQYPHLLEYQGHDIYETFEVWRSCHLSERYIIKLFTKNPLYFSISNDIAQHRIHRLNYLFRNKINRIMSVLERNPAIMDGDWNRVEENFNYLYSTMRITEKYISRSKGLSLPLQFIQLRHTFLERCGEYIRPKKKDEPGMSSRKNPFLGSILDTTDEIFALHVAKVSLDEYQVFKKLMKYEEREPVECSFEL